MIEARNLDNTPDERAILFIFIFYVLIFNMINHYRLFKAIIKFCTTNKMLIYIYIYIYIYIWRVYSSVYIYIYIYVYISVYIYIYMCVCVYVCVCVCLSMRIYLYWWNTFVFLTLHQRFFFKTFILKKIRVYLFFLLSNLDSFLFYITKYVILFFSLWLQFLFVSNDPQTEFMMTLSFCLNWKFVTYATISFCSFVADQ